MFRKSKKKKASALGQVIATIEKQAVSPVGLSFLSKYGTRLIPMLAPIVISGLGFFGFFPGCGKTASGPLEEITQKIRPGGKNEVVANDPNRPNPFQLTAAQKNQTPTPKPATPQPGVQPNSPQPANPTAGGGQDIVFAFWNCENFFDDKDDKRTGPADRDYDPWFAKNPNMLHLKLDKMTEAILSLNSGRGPDILGMCEVESIRAAQLLQAALNAKIADPRLHYQNLVMKEMNSGRHIAPAVLTRLPVDTSRTKVIGSRQRIIECHLMAGSKELIVIVAHWTSRLQDGDRQRMDYADKIYGACNAIFINNPKADIIMCGDLNDDPNDASIIKGLRATANPNEALASTGGLRLFNLMGNWTAASGGSIFYQGWHQFDQILVSPGMLDNQGWSVDPSSVRVANHLTKPNDANRRPWRFGGEKETGPRGYSDHFPVSVRLIARP
jgi:endonuclease/exonuclease/phosphatase family metal-dependent hydrolase